MSDVINTKEMISRKTVISMLKGETAEDKNTTPRINVRFVRFEPIAFAVAKRTRPLLTAIKPRLNSGRDVPKATTRAPTNIGLIPNSVVTSRAEATVNRAETIKISVPTKILVKVRVLLTRLVSLFGLSKTDAVSCVLVSL